MRERRIFFIAARHWRLAAIDAHEVNLRGPFSLANIHPEAGDRGDIGPVGIGMETQNVRVEILGLLYILRARADANTVVVQFNNFNWHKMPSCGFMVDSHY